MDKINQQLPTVDSLGSAAGAATPGKVQLCKISLKAMSTNGKGRPPKQGEEFRELHTLCNPLLLGAFQPGPAIWQTFLLSVSRLPACLNFGMFQSFITSKRRRPQHETPPVHPHSGGNTTTLKPTMLETLKHTYI